MLEAGAGADDAGEVARRDHQPNKEFENPKILPSSAPTAAGCTAGMGVGAVVVVPPLHYHGETLASAAAKGDLPHVVLLWGMVAARGINPMLPDAHVSPVASQSIECATDRPPLNHS